MGLWYRYLIEFDRTNAIGISNGTFGTRHGGNCNVHDYYCLEVEWMDGAIFFNVGNLNFK